jgi:predicted component of type VI protein secretion system
MLLTLEVISANGEKLGTERRKVFSSAGGVIGRYPDCDWVLPGKHISRRHATVLCQNGAFWIRPEGQNGLRKNDPARALSIGASARLEDGDVLFIDDYQVLVGIEGAEDKIAGPDDGFTRARTVAEEAFSQLREAAAPAGSLPLESMVHS